MTATAEQDRVETDASEAAGAAPAAGENAAAGDAAAEGAAPDPRTTLRIVSGNPTDEDVAVVVAVLSAAAAGGAPVEDSRPPESWGDPTHLHRTYAPFSPYSFTANPTQLFHPR